MTDILLRSTFIVGDLDAAIRFYTEAFGWRVAYDNVLAVDWRFPPTAPDGAPARLVFFESASDDPEIGGIGFMKYLNHSMTPGPSKHRKTVGEGEAILVVKSADPDAAYQRILKTEAVVVAPPTDWTVPGAVKGQVIRLRTMSLFDPNGIYLEVNLRYPD
jgi:catechol 2,3-dioxygenase-like lactoylglutathione lyase family enzyme